MPFGLNVTAGYGMRDFKDSKDTAYNYYGKVGYKFGIHALAVEYGLTNDLDQKGDKSSSYGAGYVVAPWKGVELYAACASSCWMPTELIQPILARSWPAPG